MGLLRVGPSSTAAPAEVLATIMALPMAEDVDAQQLQALKDLSGIRLRELSQQCARDFAR